MKSWYKIVFFAPLFLYSTIAFSAELPLKVGFNCESHIDALAQPTLPPNHQVIVETPRLVLVQSEDSFQILIIHRDTSLILGDITMGNGESLPIYFSDFAQGQGFATEAKFALMKYAFDHLRVNHIHAEVFNLGNTASRKLHTKLGFVAGGEDPTQFEILESEFRLLERMIEEKFQGDLVAFSKPSKKSLAVKK